jgi:hypothetical protein
VGAVNEGDAGPVDTYLDGMFDRLAGTGAAGRRMLTEAEDHLRAATADACERGLDPAAAEREAVTRFGPPEVTQPAGGSTAGPIAITATVVGIGLAGYGVAGFLGSFMRALSGRYVPDCGSCSAQAGGHAGIGGLLGSTSVAVAATTLGLAALCAVAIAWSRSRRTGVASALWRNVAKPAVVVFSALAVILFGVAVSDGSAGLWSLAVHHVSTGAILLAFALLARHATPRLPSPAPLTA